MNLQLNGRVALVTGASAGIGRGIAKALADEGVQLVLVARRGNYLEELAEEILEGSMTQPLAIPADLRTHADVQHVCMTALDHFGHVDIVVNNAGTSLPIALGADEGAWAEAFDLQFSAPRRLCELLLPAMREQQWGRIINIGGTLEPTGVNGSTIAKAALDMWAKSLSREVARFSVTVNTIIPGRIMSEQITSRLHPTIREREAFAAENIPVAVFGEPEDLAHLVVFLASPLARYITGEVIHVDGGMHRFAF